MEYTCTTDELDSIKSTYFKDGYLFQRPSKLRKMFIAVYVIASSLKKDLYSEKELNEELKMKCENYVEMRRYLVDYHFLSRDNYGKEYTKNHDVINATLK